jgi:23S rRNA pseudouridine2605 synthase
VDPKRRPNSEGPRRVTKKKPQKTAKASPEESTKSPDERLQKVLAAAGIGSRRQCEELILEGRVEIDGQVVEQLGVKVDPLKQEIRVDGTRLPRPTRRYYVVNKPVGVVCTNRDPAGRMRLIDLLPTEERLFSVGRLDRSSEGMILLTNDGEFANRLTHPRYGVEKTYRVIVAGRPETESLQQLVKGVHLAEGFARAVSVRVKKKHKDSADLEVVLNEGKNREIRRVLARIGHKVLRLKRIAIGSVKLADLPVGESRRLTQQEIRALLSETERKPTRQAPRSGGPKRTGRKSNSPPPRTTSRSRTTDVPPPRTGAVLTFESESDSASQSRPPKKSASRKAALRGTAGRTGAARTGAARTGAGRTGAARTGAARTGAGQTGAGQTGAGQTGAGRTGAGRTGAGRTGAGRTGAGQTKETRVGKGLQKRKNAYGGASSQRPGVPKPGTQKSGGRKSGKRSPGRGRG